MSKQAILGFLVPVVFLVLVSVGATQHKLIESSLQSWRPPLERLKDEDVTVVLVPETPVYFSMEEVLRNVDGVVIGTVLVSKPHFEVHEFNAPIVYTDYKVAVENDFGNPFQGYRAGQTAVVRMTGGRVKVGEHFFELSVPSEGRYDVGDKGIFFLMKENLPEGPVYGCLGLLRVKGDVLEFSELARHSLPFSAGKSPKEFMRDVQSAAPLLRITR